MQFQNWAGSAQNRNIWRHLRGIKSIGTCFSSCLFRKLRFRVERNKLVDKKKSGNYLSSLNHWHLMYLQDYQGYINNLIANELSKHCNFIKIRTLVIIFTIVTSILNKITSINVLVIDS